MIYNIDELRKSYYKGEKFKFVFFGGHTPPKDGSVDKSCFSQWWMYCSQWMERSTPVPSSL